MLTLHSRAALAHVLVVWMAVAVAANDNEVAEDEAVRPASIAASASKPTSWASDNGNGSYSNPLFYEEFSDPDVIRVGEDYYLAGTTMHAMPGLIVLHSKDLVNWELASYCVDRLDLGPAFRLQGGEVYGQGLWAPCIRYHQGTFYVFSNVNRFGTQVFRSKSPFGPWARNQLPVGLHDLSVLFDDDGKTYAVHGARNMTIVQLNAELTDVVRGTERPVRADGMGEGAHFYKIRGKYYLVSALPGAHTDMVVARSDSLDGPWEVERMVANESLGVPTQNGLRVSGQGTAQTFTVTPSDPNAGGGLTLHQGGIVDTPSGQWWGIIMQDHGSIGRLSALVPVTWDNGFPLIGLPGNLRKAPNTWIKPDTGHPQAPMPLFVRSDSFDSGKLNPLWQWNHVPDDAKWSLTHKPGVLRLHSLPASDFWTARNTLTQRAVGPECVVTVEIDGSGMKTGDVAGLALLNQPYAWIGLAKTAKGLEVQSFDQLNGNITTEPARASRLWLRAACNFDDEEAVLSWSPDGKAFRPLIDPFTMVFQLKTFQGVRYSLFHYNTSGNPGGYVDFDNFTVDEPRAFGAERSIPVDKSITLASVANGGLLVSSDNDMTLRHGASASSAAGALNAQFRVVYQGNGRVALQAANGRFVSVSPDGAAVVLKDVAPIALTDAETFQWVTLLRGHVMLMSLVNHRYIYAPPDAPGPVTATATGPRPDRKDGSCFTWKEAG